MKTSITARAHTNIALIKYWGKRDQKLFLPTNSSLSLTLNEFYTDTRTTFLEDEESDLFFLNGVEQSEAELKKVQRFLNLFREHTGNYQPIRIESHNHVPTAAGLASSASAYAALGLSLNHLLDLHLSLGQLSTFVRQGSGSATRSLFGGFVEWDMGTDSETSQAIPIDDASWNIAMITVPVNTKQKTLSSREGMQRTVETSAFYPAWIEAAKADLIAIKEAIKDKDFIRMGEITEANGMKMHGTMLGALPPFSYWEPLTVSVLNRVREIRESYGLACYFTMDAGPNVKILCRYSDSQRIKQLLDDYFPMTPSIISTVGPGAHLLEENKKGWLA